MAFIKTCSDRVQAYKWVGWRIGARLLHDRRSAACRDESRSGSYLPGVRDPRYALERALPKTVSWVRKHSMPAHLAPQPARFKTECATNTLTGSVG